MLASDSIARFENFLASEHKSSGTISNYVRYVSDFLNALDITDTKEIDRLVVQDYFMELNLISDADPDHRSTSTLNAIQAAVKYYLLKILFWELDDIRFPRPKVTHQQTACFSEQDRDLLLSAASAYIPSPSVRSRTVPSAELTLLRLRLRAMIFLGFDCGLRVSEVIKLRFEQADSQKSIIHIVKSKRGKSRWVPYSSATRKALNDYCRHAFKDEIPQTGYLFPGKKEGHYLSSATVSKYFRDLLFQCGFDRKHYRFHSLRHGFASWHVEHKTSPYDLAALLGHSSIATTMIYFNVSPARISHLPTPCQSMTEAVSKRR